MSDKATTALCPGCGGCFPQVVGPVHRYMKSSPGCWAVYGEVLAREYSQPAYFRAHKFTVDAYAAQHPGQPSPQSIQSVAVHLIRLCLMLEEDFGAERATAVMQKVATSKTTFRWLEPPSSRGEITVVDVHSAATAEEHVSRVGEWAASAWDAWAAYHKIVRGWLLEQAAWRPVG